mgnify:FL=1
MKIFIHASKELCGKHERIGREIWKLRTRLDPPKRDGDERVFLPANLEITETPISAAPKYIARTIIFFTIIAFLWALIGKIDIVAVTQGKTIVTGHSKQIQSLETSVVKNIYVKNGDYVRAGQKIIELSGIGSDSDSEQSRRALEAAQLTKLRNDALMEVIEKGGVIKIDKSEARLAGLKEPEVIAAEELARNQFEAWSAENDKLQAILSQHLAELRSNQDQVHKLEQIKKIELQRSKDYQALLEKKYLSQHEYFEQDSKTIQNEHDLRSLRNQTQQIEESIHQAEQEKRLNIQTFHRDTLDALREANEQIPQLRGQLEKAEQRQSLMNLKAPVDGTVQQMAFHTLGGVVMEGQAIMTIVPLDDKIEVETMIANKDIGFVNVGQDVVVKIESFPYTRYGYITGKVTSVSFDAIENEKLGLVFSAIVSLDKNYLLVEGKRINLVAGMNVSAEIKTGKRKVIDYLLSPLQTKVDESFKER